MKTGFYRHSVFLVKFTSLCDFPNMGQKKFSSVPVTCNSHHDSALPDTNRDSWKMSAVLI